MSRRHDFGNSGSTRFRKPPRLTPTTATKMNSVPLATSQGEAANAWSISAAQRHRSWRMQVRHGPATLPRTRRPRVATERRNPADNVFGQYIDAGSALAPRFQSRPKMERRGGSQSPRQPMSADSAASPPARSRCSGTRPSGRPARWSDTRTAWRMPHLRPS